MKFAVLGDIHGNIHALDAVLEQMADEGADFIVGAGDLVGYGAFPGEVIARIRSERIPFVMGNYDEGTGFDKPECGCAYTDSRMAEWGHQSLQWTQAHVSGDDKAYLRGLPERVELRAYGLRVAVVHGSPRKINEYLTADRPEASIRRLMEPEELDVLICGHTHIPYCRQIGERVLINAGSVGKPKDGNPRAGYVLVSLNENGVQAELRRVSYDVEAAAVAIEKSGLPPELAAMLREGRG